MKWFNENPPNYIMFCDCPLCDGVGNIVDNPTTFCYCCFVCSHGKLFVGDKAGPEIQDVQKR